MRRRARWHWNLVSDRSAALLALCVAFLLGGAVGCLAAGTLGVQQRGALLAEVRACISSLGSGYDFGQFFDVLWRFFCVPIALILLGFSALGVVALPAMLFARGFLLSYAISAFYRLLGLKGLLAGAILFVLSALFWLPAILRLGTQGLLGACGLMRRLRGDVHAALPFNKTYFFHCGICAVTLCFGAAVEYYFVPRLLQAVSGVLPIS